MVLALLILCLVIVLSMLKWNGLEVILYHCIVALVAQETSNTSMWSDYRKASYNKLTVTFNNVHRQGRI